MQHFVPAADEVSWLQHRDGIDCRMFQRFAELGHYGGRTEPSNTRQGIYAVSPSGELLASVNTQDPRALATMLSRALEAWEALPDEQRWLPEGQTRALARVRRWRDSYPTNGLVLAVTLRDTAEQVNHEWHADVWNRDYAWFLPREARSFLPRQPEPGRRHRVPVALVDRLARFHLTDSVRGQTPAYQTHEIIQAHLVSEVVKVVDEHVHLELRGKTIAEAHGRWPVAGFDKLDEVGPQERGFEADLLGQAVFDLETQRFVSFELVGNATRWGATQFNGRRDDPGPAPVGVVMELADPSHGRIPPAHFGKYSSK